MTLFGIDRLLADPDLRRPLEGNRVALLAHPALVALFPPERRIALPERLTVCGGPSLPAALDWLAGESAS